MLDRLERRPDWQLALGIAVTLRVIYSVVAAIASQVLHPALSRIATNFTGDFIQFNGLACAFLGVWQRFDTLIYLHIAVHGYDQTSLTVFYPLYPLAIRVLLPAFGTLGSALLISNLSAFFAFWGFLRLATPDSPRLAALRGLLLYAVWPASFILFAGYVESLTLALVLWSVYFARAHRWWVSALCGCGAALARPTGGLVFLPLLFFAWQQRRQKPWPVFLVFLGLMAYPVWRLWQGQPSFVTVYKHYWQIDIAPPWITLAHILETLFRRPDAVFLLNLLILVAIALLAAMARPRPAYSLYAAALILQILTRNEQPLLLGAPRYLLLVFPAFLALGDLVQNSPRFQRMFWPLCGLLLFCNLGFMWAFLNWSLAL